VDLELGTSLKEIMSDQKPILDCLLEGFEAKVSLTYLKKLKQTLMKAPIEKMQKVLAMGGFGLQLGVKADLELEFDDIEEIKEHPLAGGLAGMTFGAMLEQFSKEDRKYLEGNFKWQRFNQEKEDEVKKIVEQHGEKANMMITWFKKACDLGSLIKSIGLDGSDGPTKISLFVEGSMLAELDVSLPGTGNLANMVYRKAGKEPYQQIC
jgi:hypothetical protein